MSMGAIYIHFKNKAELLVEALETKIAEDLESMGASDDGPINHVQRLTAAGRDIGARRDLRALLVQAAAASQTDEETHALGCAKPSRLMSATGSSATRRTASGCV